MNILFFGPNGSGKGTQGAILKDKYKTPHIESGAIFRENISKGTMLGKKAKAFIDCGDLVPDDITIPMILDRLKQADCKNGWLLDGFPRNKNQAVKLDESLKAAGMALDIVVEIVLDREIGWDGWALADNRIYFQTLTEKSGQIHWSIEFLDLETEGIQILHSGIGYGHQDSLGVSPDETRLIFNRSEPWEGNIMLVENFR